MILISTYTLAPETRKPYQLTARPWVCAVPQFINSFDKDDARLRLTIFKASNIPIPVKFEA